MRRHPRRGDGRLPRSARRRSRVGRSSTPSPVLALPCGSRSMISTRSPTAASAVPRLIAVVVLPTPPFWLASARTRVRLVRRRSWRVRLVARERSDVTSTICESARGQARMKPARRSPSSPARPRSRLRLRGPSGTAPGVAGPKNGLASSEQTRQRRKRPRAHHVRPKALGAFGELFNAHRVDVHRRPWSRARPRRETRISCRLLSTRCMRKSGLPVCEDGDDEPGKTCP